MKNFINLNSMKWFRRLFLNYLLKKVKKHINNNSSHYFLCYSLSIYRLFISWKELKEVQDNLDSKYIYKYIRHYKLFKDGYCWFLNNKNRKLFLEECLKLLNK